MKAIINYLEKLGFSKIEIKIYIRLLSSGPLSVAELADKIKMNRTSIYKYLSTLADKGILTQLKGESNKVAANPPEQLQYIVEQKITIAHSLKEKLPGILNTLSVAFPQQENIQQSEIKYFKGKNGINIIYKEILRAEKIQAYCSLTDLKKLFPENFDLFTDAINNNSKMEMYELCEDSDFARELLKLPNSGRHKYKFLPSDIKLTANDILIYDGKVAIINLLDKSDMHGVIMSNKDYYNSSKQLFDLLWRLLPEPKID